MPIIVRILTAGTDDQSCRIAIARMNDTCEMSPPISTVLPTPCLQGCMPHRQARLTSTANGCQHIAVWHHEVWHSTSSEQSFAVRRTPLHQPPAASTHRSCSHCRPKPHQRHGGPLWFQLTMPRTKTTDLGYIDNPKTLNPQWSGVLRLPNLNGCGGDI